MSEITPITMPKWGLTMTEGKVVEWLKKEGDSYRPGEELLEIETTKITNVFEASEPGRLRRILAPTGAILPIGALLAVSAPEDVPEAEIDAFIADFAAPAAAAEMAADAAAPAPRDIEVAGKRLRLLDLGGGDGVPVLLLHGFGADLNTWMFNQPALAETRRVVALDLPGHGVSAKELGGADPASFAALVEAALAALGIERVHLAGHSLGGGIALALAAAHPGRVASLSLIAPAGLGPEINGDFIAGFIGAQRRREMQQVLSLLVHDPALISRQMVEDVLRYKRLDGVAAALEQIAAAWFPGGTQRLLNAEFAGLSVPGQIIWGREDRIIPVAHGGSVMGQIPVHILPATGHLPHMERPGDVTRLLQALIAG